MHGNTAPPTNQHLIIIGERSARLRTQLTMEVCKRGCLATASFEVFHLAAAVAHRSHGTLVGPTSSQSCSSETTLFGARWNLSRIFREISCGHLPWKLEDENQPELSTEIHRIVRLSLTNISPKLRSGGLLA